MLTFANKREPGSYTELSELERQQLVVAGRLWDGRDLPVEARLDPEAPCKWEDPNLHGMFEIWDVLEDGQLRYTAMLYMVDSGTFFDAGTTERVAEVMQGYLDCSDEELYAAMAGGISSKKADGGEYPRVAHRG